MPYELPMIVSFQNKALKRFWSKGDATGIKPEWRTKVRIMLTALEALRQPPDMDMPGFGFHALTGDLEGRFSISVSRNWRITFGWSGEDAVSLDLEDYHGGS
jgi:proteic killer suppression protein